MAEELDVEKGIQAIIDLQDTMGIKETREQALAGWNKMSQHDKVQTMAAHRMVCKDKYT
jgi:hypothetical protein